ncbi:MAG: hypothetical protein L6282_08100 [Candidatus Methanoperedenaceae archaeon]|nr:hypothetical protein [Candidatus Methanoperedenaceae archaeon]
MDFVLKEGEKIIELIQVSYASDKNDIDEREIKSLQTASLEMKCKKLTLITWDFEGEIRDIKCVPLWKWLVIR